MEKAVILDSSIQMGEEQSFQVHANEDLGKGLLNDILKQIKLSKEEYEELRKQV